MIKEPFLPQIVYVNASQDMRVNYVKLPQLALLELMGIHVRIMVHQAEQQVIANVTAKSDSLTIIAKHQQSNVQLLI